MRPLLLTLLLSSSLSLFPQKRLTLLFAGDLMQHQAQIDAARQPDGSYDYGACFAPVRSLIEGADVAIGNLEVTLGGLPYKGYPAFSAPDEYLTAIHEAGFDVLLTANNHCLDRGRKGLERTIRLLDSLHIPHLGTYRTPEERQERLPLLIEKNGFRIALLNYTSGTNGIRVTPPNVVDYIARTVMADDIRHARSLRPDALIVCIHWGEEYQRTPNTAQRQLADWLLAQGVTHIIGSHPHVVQPVEVCSDGLERHVVVYSLGNFLSNMSAPHTDGGLVVTLELEKQPLPPPALPRTPCLISRPTTDEAWHYPDGNCHLRSYRTHLVWVARPRLTGQRSFQLLRTDSLPPALPAEARSRALRFVQATERLLQP